MNQIKVIGAAAGLLLATVGPVAAEVFKSVDEYGNVVYSSSPFGGPDPDAAEPVRIDAGPTDADRTAAERRLQALQTPAPDAAGVPGGGPPQQPPPPPQSAPTQTTPIDGRADEAVQRAQTTSREHRSAGGFAGDQRSRRGASLSSERTSR